MKTKSEIEAEGVKITGILEAISKDNTPILNKLANSLVLSAKLEALQWALSDSGETKAAGIG